MATFYLCECKDCGLTSDVTLEDSAIFAGAIRSGYCVHCEDFQSPILAEGYFLEAALTFDQRKAFTCSIHDKTPLVGWFRGQRCPRCGGNFDISSDEFSLIKDVD